MWQRSSAETCEIYIRSSTSRGTEIPGPRENKGGERARFSVWKGENSTKVALKIHGLKEVNAKQRSYESFEQGKSICYLRLPLRATPLLPQ